MSGSSVSERSQARSSQVSGAGEELDPAQDGALRIFLRWALQTGPKNRVGHVVGQAMPTKLGEVRRAQIARPPARDPGVERDDDALEARRLGAIDQAGGHLAVSRRIQLKKPRSIAERGGNIFHGVHWERRGNHRHAGGRGRARGGQIPVTVLGAQPDDADRRHEERRRQGQAAQVDGQVTFCGADEHAWHQAPLREGRAVGLLSALVTGSATYDHSEGGNAISALASNSAKAIGSDGTTPASPWR